MTPTGIVRRIDRVGRLVLPIELRPTLQIEDNDSLEIFIDDNAIVLKKYQQSCIFCGNNHDIIRYKDRLVCAECITQLNENRE